MMETDINICTQTVDEGVLRLVKIFGIQKSGSVGKPFATVERTYEISDRLLTGVVGITVSPLGTCDKEIALSKQLLYLLDGS